MEYLLTDTDVKTDDSVPLVSMERAIPGHPLIVQSAEAHVVLIHHTHTFSRMPQILSRLLRSECLKKISAMEIVARLHHLGTNDMRKACMCSAATFSSPDYFGSAVGWFHRRGGPTGEGNCVSPFLSEE